MLIPDAVYDVSSTRVSLEEFRFRGSGGRLSQVVWPVAQCVSAGLRRGGTPFNPLIAMGKFDRITFDPEILGGRATIRGMRMSVEQVVSLFGSGMSVEEILQEYPYLEKEDIWQSIRYFAELLARELNP